MVADSLVRHEAGPAAAAACGDPDGHHAEMASEDGPEVAPAESLFTSVSGFRRKSDMREAHAKKSGDNPPGWTPQEK